MFPFSCNRTISFASSLTESWREVDSTALAEPSLLHAAVAMSASVDASLINPSTAFPTLQEVHPLRVDPTNRPDIAEFSMVDGSRCD